MVMRSVLVPFNAVTYLFRQHCTIASPNCTVLPWIIKETLRFVNPRLSGFLRTMWGPMPSSARIFEPILFFLPQKEKNGFNPPRKERGHSKSEAHPVPPSCNISVTQCICPPQITPNCDPAQRSQFGKEEGASGYGAFAASAEAECSWLLLHAVLMMAARQQPADVVSFLHIKNRPTVWDDFL